MAGWSKGYTMEKSITVLPEEADLRLDRVLGRLVPEMGLRGRRRLCELGLTLVNGHPAKESRKLRVPMPNSHTVP